MLLNVIIGALKGIWCSKGSKGGCWGREGGVWKWWNKVRERRGWKWNKPNLRRYGDLCCSPRKLLCSKQHNSPIHANTPRRLLPPPSASFNISLRQQRSSNSTGSLIKSSAPTLQGGPGERRCCWVNFGEVTFPLLSSNQPPSPPTFSSPPFFLRPVPESCQRRESVNKRKG